MCQWKKFIKICGYGIFIIGFYIKAEGTNCKSWDCPVDYPYGCEQKDLGIVSDS